MAKERSNLLKTFFFLLSVFQLLKQRLQGDARPLEEAKRLIIGDAKASWPLPPDAVNLAPPLCITPVFIFVRHNFISKE